MSLNNSEFDDVRRDEDADEPLDGRDAQPAQGGSSDVPQSLDAEDPLRGADLILDENDQDPLQLNPETLLPEPLDEEREVDAEETDTATGLDEERRANLPDGRETPDQE